MITQLSNLEENKAIFFELLFNHTNKVTKISNASVLNGVGYGVASLGQKAIKDIAVIETHIFPDSAYGTYLDKVANDYGIAPRFGASGSSTYLRLVGIPGTTYLSGVNTFSSTSGYVFDLETDITIGAYGFVYAKIRSQKTEINTNVDPLTINKVTPSVSGHQYCINEYRADGGRDTEDDELFRRRIKTGSNILARGTLATLEQAFMLINNNVLKIYYQGMNSTGQTVIAIQTQNGIDLSPFELSQLLITGQQFFSLADLKPNGLSGYGISLTNITWLPIDVAARLELFPSYNPDDVRKEIQIRLNKYFDYRYFNKTLIQWTDLLQLIKSTPGVKFVLDNIFTPNQDIPIPLNYIPRMRGFLMLNPDGSLISNASNTLNPVFYPNSPDLNFTSTVLSSL